MLSDYGPPSTSMSSSGVTIAGSAYSATPLISATSSSGVKIPTAGLAGSAMESATSSKCVKIPATGSDGLVTSLIQGKLLQSVTGQMSNHICSVSAHFFPGLTKLAG